MANNIVAYIGIDSFDIVLYQAYILSKLGKKVLVIDHTNTRAIACSIPIPQGLDISKDSITIRRVDFSTMMLDESIIGAYDDILIAYHTYMENTSHMFTKVIYVTDLYLHSMEHIRTTLDISGVKKSLVIRNVVGVKITQDMIIYHTGTKIAPEEITYIYMDENDISNAILCQFNQKVCFTRISKQMREYLLKETKAFYPDIEYKDIKEAYRKARKGD